MQGPCGRPRSVRLRAGRRCAPGAPPRARARGGW
jgi:hypothetical protein